MRALTPASRHVLASCALTAAALVTAFSLPVPAHAWSVSIVTGPDDGHAIAGSGHGADVRRAVGAFSRLRLDDAIDVEARPAASPGVTVHADDNIVPYIETVVEGDTLVVRVKPGTSLRTHRTLKVDVDFTQLQSTAQHGSGDLHLTGVAGKRLESSISGSGDLQIDDAQLEDLQVGVSGSGDVKVEGRADHARFDVQGSGDIEAGRLAARKVEVAIAGSGDAHVNASESLEARVAGSGDVTYRGHPRDVTRHVAGSGSVDSDD